MIGMEYADSAIMVIALEKRARRLPGGPFHLDLRHPREERSEDMPHSYCHHLIASPPDHFIARRCIFHCSPVISHFRLSPQSLAARRAVLSSVPWSLIPVPCVLNHTQHLTTPYLPRSRRHPRFFLRAHNSPQLARTAPLSCSEGAASKGAASTGAKQ